MFFEIITRGNIFKAGSNRLATDIHGVFATSYTRLGMLVI